MSEQRDEFAAERRETIIEALSWWEDEDGRWGHERARDVLAAHEDEWCGVPPTQPPAAPETDVSGRLTAVERDVIRIKAAHGGIDSVLLYVEGIVAERVRVVEGERDAAMAEERERIAQAIEAERDLDPRTPFGLGLASAAQIAREAR